MTDLPTLAARVRDQASVPDTVAALREELESRLQFIVRMSLRRGVNSSSLNHRILQEAKAVSPQYEDHSPAEREQLIRWITRRLSDRVIHRLHSKEPDQANVDTLYD